MNEPDHGRHGVHVVMDQQKRWEEFLPLVEFAYNNNYQSTIKMVPFEFFMGDCVECL
jgi:hypothetical protein